MSPSWGFPSQDVSKNWRFSSHGASSRRGFSPRVRDEAFLSKAWVWVEAWSIFPRRRTAIVFPKVKIVVVSKIELIEEQNSVDKDTFEEQDALKKVDIVSVVDIDL